MTAEAVGKERIGLIGVGLIGGSLGLAWRQRGLEVTGYDADPAVLRKAEELGAIDRGESELERVVRSASVVVLATPVRTTIELAGRLPGHLSEGALVTDVGSTKAEVCRAFERLLPSGIPFIGGHPMAGSEERGVGAADPFLFENAVYLLTPPEGARGLEEPLERLRRLVRALGARPVILSPEAHDRAVAAVSHLPQLAAVALVESAAQLEKEVPGALGLAAGGFRDTTRIAASPPGMWLDVCATNRRFLLSALSTFRRVLDRLEQAVAEEDLQHLREAFETAREQHARLPRAARGYLPTQHELVVRLEDRPGEIGRMASRLGEAGVNLQDIEILRVREGEGGTIRLGFASEAEAETALAVLLASGYKAMRR